MAPSKSIITVTVELDTSPLVQAVEALETALDKLIRTCEEEAQRFAECAERCREACDAPAPTPEDFHRGGPLNPNEAILPCEVRTPEPFTLSDKALRSLREDASPERERIRISLREVMEAERARRQAMTPDGES